ncbi:MAG: LOG family protein [Parachlamydiaceae bacterium]
MTINVNSPEVVEKIHELLSLCGAVPESFEGELIAQMIQTSLRLSQDKHDTGQIKLINRALKEMRYAYNIFNQYKELPRISIFGSARTPETHPDYQAARRFSFLISELGWMCITGAANGIMRAGLEGAKAETSFGLSIRLPFETPSSLIHGDPKLIMFRYFFTRKLMFVSHSHAAAFFPGGVGTMDELFEVLTLIQTGKANIIPVVLMEGNHGDYWHHWHHYVHKYLLGNGWISEEDEALFYIAPSVEAGAEHIERFYKRYHSSRYVHEWQVLRIKSPLTEEQLSLLNKQFASLLEKGAIIQGSALPEEDDALDLPRLILCPKRREAGLLRRLIDKVNEL